QGLGDPPGAVRRGRGARRCADGTTPPPRSRRRSPSAQGRGGPRRGAAAGGMRIRGYYRAGSLPRLLRRDGVDLALLLSIVPESYSLVLSECRAAGVPVVAFDHGAVADRIRAEGGGLLVAPEEGGAR